MIPSKTSNDCDASSNDVSSGIGGGGGGGSGGPGGGGSPGGPGGGGGGGIGPGPGNEFDLILITTGTMAGLRSVMVTAVIETVAGVSAYIVLGASATTLTVSWQLALFEDRPIIRTKNNIVKIFALSFIFGPFQKL
ncbi:MAG: hypothetical protein GWN67_15600 [Phycisphaerae bacterium]|nr:hypothetical protein [Phycisphaerae bacterium]NIR65784.1 hypothetical protein [candidate division Zixibacteria bacterium]NIP51060.1 hypothetical protein [Phycisphaerae bacterium]NIS52504.1 hypothetical protein [Phycisphaerae bacterium]NIU10039.1 hypothetical protein [Phycisphaerae bacterium]